VKIAVQFLTNPGYIADCALFTANRYSDGIDAATLRKYILAEHSPLRAFIIEVDMLGIPAYSASVHFARHKIGVEHFVSSNRPDRAGKEREIDDMVNHRMVINYQALVNIARRRLCSNAAPGTREVMEAVKIEIGKQARWCYGDDIGHVLEWGLRPECQYRGGCPEFKPCGRASIAQL
jgi:hypothetical protein